MRRKGFTVIEVLVVVSIFGIMIALLLPAIEGARQACKRTQCQNNLRQIAIALHTYHHDFEVFPPGYSSRVGDDGRDHGPGWGWSSFFLPEIEYLNRFTCINFALPITHPENCSIAAMSMSIFICSADSHHLTGLVVKDIKEGSRLSVPPAQSSYVGSFGTGDPEATAGRDASDGVFYRNSWVTIERITDGLSTTFLVGERTQEVGWSTWAGMIDDVPGNPHRPLGPSLVLGSTLGNNGPNASPSHPAQFASRHEGGAFFAFGDGSVRFVTNPIDKAIYHSLATRSGGEIVENPE